MAEESTGQNALTLGAADYVFDWPETITAGRTEITMENTGRDLHHAYLWKLNDGVSADDLVPAMDRLLAGDLAGFAEVGSLVTFDGGPGILTPGASQTLVLDLDPGNYVWICGLPAADGEAHYTKGMLAPFEVIEGESGAVLDEPVADGTVVLQDFAFGLPGSVPAGPQRWQVTNEGGQPHELLLAQLAPGATALDFAMAFGDPAATEAPPGLPFGGIGPMEPGTTAWLDLDLSPGTYAAFCFIPDPDTGQPHIALGMVSELTVEAGA
jgi:hypothetical protein